MKIAYFSDIHTEFGEQPTAVKLGEHVDVLVLAGDIGEGLEGIDFARTFSDQATDIVIVAGNHEYYGSTLQKMQAKMRDHAAQFPNIHFLENDIVEINDWTFIGSTAWTDFRAGDKGQPLNLIHAKGLSKGTGLRDYEQIKWYERASQRYRKIMPTDVLKMNADAHLYIFGQLRDRDPQKCIVITHHAPTEMSIHPKFERDPLNPCYASRWGNDIAYHGPKIWFHGHTHEPADYEVGDTRVLCWPIGYPHENTSRMPNIIEI